MTTNTTCRRRHRRHRMDPGGGACLEFTYPQPNGAPMTVSLLDLSPSGFSFALNEELQHIEAGLSIDGVTVKLGDTEINGDILVIHVNIERGVSGALFYPSTDIDLIKLRSAVAALGVAGSG